MNNEEFLKKVEIELKISKNAEYTIRNYIRANKELLKYTKKTTRPNNKRGCKGVYSRKHIRTFF